MAPIPHSSDESLISASSTNGEAFGCFYDRHRLVLLSALRQRVGDTEVALDLTAEVFAAALASRERFSDRGPGSARAWLFGIARHKLLDLYQSGVVDDTIRRQLSLHALEVSDEALLALEERLDAQHSDVLQALAELPEHERTAVKGRVVDDVDYAQLAEQFCVSESVIRKRVSRGLRRLRATLEAK
jgi:RNA polymerase sigma-70 factor (ECF subfamily)